MTERAQQVAGSLIPCLHERNVQVTSTVTTAAVQIF